MGENISGNSFQDPTVNYSFNAETTNSDATYVTAKKEVTYSFTITADTIGTDFKPLHFTEKGAYTSESQTPTLFHPQTDEQNNQTQPYGETEQKMVKQFFSDNVVTALKQKNLTPEDGKKVYDAIMNGTTLSDPELQEIAVTIGAEATAKTIEEGNLPSTWTVTSTKAQDWTPKPIIPYSSEQQANINEYYDQAVLDKATTYLQDHALELDPDQAIKLINAVKTGVVSSDIADIYLQLTSEARVETQAAFGLPNTWFKGTQSVDDWKPINVGIITPAKVAAARLEGMLGNVETIFNDVSAAAQKLLDGPPPLAADDPNRIALTEFLKIIGTAIKDLKATLREIQIRDAEKSKENTKSKFSQLADRRLRAEEQSKKLEESLKKQRQMKSMGLSMKIIGPIIAALATILGALIAIATLGTATVAGVALIAAGVAIGIAMTAYSIADSITGVTQKIVEAFKNALEKMMPNAPDWAKALVKALIVAVIVAILAVVIVAAMATGSGAGAATNIASQAVAQTVRAAVVETVKQIALQAMIMVIMSSNALPELVGGILKAAGVDKKTQQAIEMVVMAITLIVCMVVMAKVGGAGTKGADAAKDAAEKSTTEVAKTVQERARELLTRLGEQMDKLKDNVKNLPANIKEEFKGTVDAFRKLDKWDVLNAAAQSAPAAVQVVGGAVTGAMTIKAARLQKEVGEIKSAEELLEGMIQALEQLLKNIQSGMSSRDDFIAQLQQIYTDLYKAADKSYGQLFNSIQG